ncbi:unnamed protein product [Arctogadus glacialis]
MKWSDTPPFCSSLTTALLLLTQRGPSNSFPPLTSSMAITRACEEQRSRRNHPWPGRIPGKDAPRVRTHKMREAESDHQVL